MKKIAVLHWGTKSVGGINTTLRNYRDVADRRGDLFHVYLSNPASTHHFGLYPKPVELGSRGDTYIRIDGVAPHHPKNWQESLAGLLSRGYTHIMTSFICPHPTKAYGSTPYFLPLVTALSQSGIPLIGYIHDAYWDTYAEWAKLVIPLCQKVMVCQKPYADNLAGLGYKNIIAAYPPFQKLLSVNNMPIVLRDLKRLVWLPQWKNVKGIYRFIDGLPELARLGISVDLYNTGIEYYKLKKTPEWRSLVGENYVDLSATGHGSAKYFGFVALDEIPYILSGSGFMSDFQGERAKYDAYKNGSYNHTILEAMYYGAVPVVHSNMLKSGIPGEFLLAIDDLKDYPKCVAAYDAMKYPAVEAREWVEKTHSAERLYDAIFE